MGKLHRIERERLTERVRLAFRLLRLQETGAPPRILEEMDVSLTAEILAYLETLQITDSRTYDKICDEHSEVIRSLRRGELEHSSKQSSLRYFAHQLASELRQALRASESEEDVC